MHSASLTQIRGSIPYDAPVITTTFSLAILEARFALPNFYDVPVRIAYIASYLAVLIFRFGEKCRSPTSPELVARMNIRNANIHEATNFIGVGRRSERYRWFVRCRTAPHIENEPNICDFDIRRCVPVASADNLATKDRFIELNGSLEIGHSEKVSNGKPLLRWHLIVCLLDFHFVH